MKSYQRSEVIEVIGRIWAKSFFDRQFFMEKIQLIIIVNFINGFQQIRILPKYGRLFLLMTPKLLPALHILLEQILAFIKNGTENSTFMV